MVPSKGTISANKVRFSANKAALSRNRHALFTNNQKLLMEMAPSLPSDGEKPFK